MLTPRAPASFLVDVCTAVKIVDDAADLIQTANNVANMFHGIVLI